MALRTVVALLLGIPDGTLGACPVTVFHLAILSQKIFYFRFTLLASFHVTKYT